MRTQTLLDEPTPSTLRPQRQALEPPDIFVVEEHVAHGDDALVDLVWVACEDDAFGNDAVGAGGKGGACCDEAEGVGCGLRCVGGEDGALKVEEGDVSPCQGADEGGDGSLAGVNVAVELVHVVRRVAGLREELGYVSVVCGVGGEEVDVRD